jgi:hypothetical protein
MTRPRPFAKHLRQTLDQARYPRPPRLDPLKAILAKLELPTPKPEPPPPLQAGMAPSSLVVADCGRQRRQKLARQLTAN